MKATFIRTLEGFKGVARLYTVEPPITYEKYVDGDPVEKAADYVVVSAVNAFGMGNETYIFPADKDGEIVDWGELPGSFKGALDHETALENAGYFVAAETDVEK